MPLSSGDTAPDFTLYDSDTQPFNLSDELSDGPVVLLFFPGAFTSVCTNELDTVGNDLGEYAGAQVVGVSTDSPFALAEFKKVHDFPFRLLSDHDGSVSADYGTKYDNDFTPMKLDRIAKRSAFVIDRDQNIRYAEVLDNAGEMPNLDAVKKTVGEVAA
ncbi:redoxin domain-containing protein [Rubricoccus marinus]|uniref:Anti-oxidant AhpCTSA family protein n=1 Tax=Rubricoccus marinus TaxID=716817 RepID=A0A259TYX6_9BACT|nr:redoxin domain-containing protein [Rubricoccus marinus]OZC02774.1 anti-oxidant AhpCTSA family protein [Rubricoccus marinus]